LYSLLAIKSVSNTYLYSIYLRLLSRELDDCPNQELGKILKILALQRTAGKKIAVQKNMTDRWKSYEQHATLYTA
jgi:hypothetical protein